VLEEYNTEEQRPVVRFFVGKRTQRNGYTLTTFTVYDRKCFSRKAVHNWVEKFSQGQSKVADDAR
jgi:hypothetical protein